MLLFRSNGEKVSRDSCSSIRYDNNNRTVKTNDMDELNHLHLQAYWRVVRAGGVNAAARQSLISASTISDQVRQLESSLGVRLLRRKGRTVEPTEVGTQVFRYADEIFALSRELRLVALGKSAPAARHFRVSAEMSVPKLLVRQFLQPLIGKKSSPRLVCREGTHDEVLQELGAHQAEVVLTDRPMTGALERRVYYHSLGTSPICLMGEEALVQQARRCEPTFEGIPMLLPALDTSLRSGFDRWAASAGAVPDVVGEFDDTALMKEFAATGTGLVALPQAVEAIARSQFGLRRVRLLEGVNVEYFAITLHRRVTDPLVESLIQHARDQLN